MKITASALKGLAKRVLAQASFGDVRVSISAHAEGNSRFALGRPSTGGDVERIEITVRASQGNKSGVAKGSATDDASLAKLVQQAEGLAALAPENPEHMPPLGKTSYDKVKALDPAAAKMGAAQRADAMRGAIAAGSKAGVEIAGFIEHDRRARVVADRAGLLGFHESTSVSMTTTCRTDDGGSARRGYVSHALAGLSGEALATEAAEWAKRSASPAALDPGQYTVVLAPAAVADLLDFLVGALDARAAMEGRSVFSKPGGETRIGEQVVAPSVELWSDPGHPAHPASPMSRDGRPQTRTVWIKDGKLVALTASRYWADKEGVPSRPRPSSIHLSGGTGTLDDLVAKVDRGVLVSRFWYNRMLRRQSLTATGLTRDGTFLIENGKISGPVKNFRYNDSPITMLSNLVAAGTPVRTPGERVTVVPPLVVEGFNFSSTSDAV